jgi:hypothetical protein
VCLLRGDRDILVSLLRDDRDILVCLLRDDRDILVCLFRGDRDILVCLLGSDRDTNRGFKKGAVQLEMCLNCCAVTERLEQVNVGGNIKPKIEM